MIEKWGYKLPNYPTDKGLRSACRAATKYCLIQDQSYIHCIDVQAPEGLLLDTLASFLPGKLTGVTTAGLHGLDYSWVTRTTLQLACPDANLIRWQWQCRIAMAMQDRWPALPSKLVSMAMQWPYWIPTLRCPS